MDKSNSRGVQPDLQKSVLIGVHAFSALMTSVC